MTELFFLANVRFAITTDYFNPRQDDLKAFMNAETRVADHVVSVSVQ